MKKRLISSLLALIMVLSLVPVSAFAENETDSGGTETAVDNPVQETIGTEAEVGNTLYYIEDSNLLSSASSARPSTVDTDVVWVRERDGLIYYAKIDGNNTDVYKSGDGGFEKYARLFCPIDAFDVEDGFLYYSYNGEVFKLDVETGKEETVLVNSELKQFYVEGKNIACIRPQNYYNDLTEDEATLLTQSKAENFDKSYVLTGDYATDIVNVAEKQIEKTKSDLGYTEPWCANFATDCARLTGMPDSIIPYNYSARGGCGSLYAYMINNCNAKVVDVSERKKGDFVFYHVSGSTYGHVGIYAGGDMLIEGNLSSPSRVRRLSYTYSDDRTRVYVRPNYSTNSTGNSGGNTAPKVKKLTLDGAKYPKPKWTKGKSFSLCGTFKSNKKITRINGRIRKAIGDEVQFWYVEPYDYTYSLYNSPIDKNLRFNTLSEGSYYVEYEVFEEGSNNPQYFTSNSFVVGSAEVLPVISEEAISGGKRIKISCSSNSGTIYYTLDGGKTNSISNNGTFNIKKCGDHTVKAWIVSGSTKSSVVTKAINVPKSKNPFIALWQSITGLFDIGIDVNYGNNCAYVVIQGEGDIYYTLDGSEPTEYSSRYVEHIPITESKTVKAISVMDGYAPSDVVEKEIIIKEPDPPVISLYNTKDKIAQGKTATVSWEPVKYATSYKASLFLNGECIDTYTTTGTKASFVLSKRSDTENFEYTIKVVATNFVGDSEYSNPAKVWGMHPVEVTFVDRIVRSGELTEDRLRDVKRKIDNHDGEGVSEKLENQIISVQKVDYDEYPSKPATPSKHGFTFAGWTAGLYEPAITDKTVYGEFEINYYNVRFWNYYYEGAEKNKQIGDTQKIMYTDSATPPTEFEKPLGYVMTGWSVDNSVSQCFDYTFVEGNMRLYTSYSWENMELPTIVEITGASRHTNCTSYSVNLRYTNNNLKDTQARIIVALYTSDNRMIYTQVKDIDMDKFKIGDSVTDTIQLNYPNIISRVSAVLVRTENDITGGAVSEMKYSTDIDFPDASGYWDAWSSWSTTAYTGSDTRQVEQKTQYRYRNKNYTTTNNTKSLSGWNYWYTDSSTGGWNYNGTNWVGTEDSDYRKREVSSEWHQNYKPQWFYSRYYGWGGSYYLAYAWRSGVCTNYEETGWLDYQLAYQADHSCGPAYGRGAVNGRDVYWYNQNNRSVENGGYYTYSYRDTYYTHHFWNWGGWSSWSDSWHSGDETQTRTVYRYRDYKTNYPGYDPNRDSKLEEHTLKEYPIEGQILDVGTEYITEGQLTEKSEIISGPYYKMDDGNYILIDESVEPVTKYRFGRYTNGSYSMPCKEEAEELYGGEWTLEWTDWMNGNSATVTENEFSCESTEHDHINYARIEDGVYYWDLYELNGESYCFMESFDTSDAVTYQDTNKYYLVKKSLEGKCGTILVYKKTNSDPTQEQLEYVEQVRFGENNSYSFTVNAKEALDYMQTGDYIVTISAEGCKRLINVDVIKAEVPKYTVNFHTGDKDAIRYRYYRYTNGTDIAPNAEEGEALYGGDWYIEYSDWYGENVANVTEKGFSCSDSEHEHDDYAEEVDGTYYWNIYEIDGEQYYCMETGDVLKTVIKEEGQSIDVNEIGIPEREGYRFVKWNKSVVDIVEDLDVYAVWEPIKYAIVFVDHKNETTELSELAYGDPIEAPEVEPVDGMIFKGWDNQSYKYVTETEKDNPAYKVVDGPYYARTDGNYIPIDIYNDEEIENKTKYYRVIRDEIPVVTESMVITAIWEPLVYTVNFADFEGNIIDTQEVKYGEAAIPPDCLSENGVTYPWDTNGSEWWSVTSDMVIYPYKYTPNDVIAPTSDLATGEYEDSQLIILESQYDTPIYYTVDIELTEIEVRDFVDSKLIDDGITLFGVDDSNANISENSAQEYNIMNVIQEYDKPILITNDSIIYAFTVKDGEISPISVYEYNINHTEEEEQYEIDPDCPQITLPSLTVKPGETVEVPVSIKNNPGLTNLSLVFGYDSSNLTLVSATNGDVFANTEYSADTREDGNCKFTWLSKSLNEKDGTLLTLTFKAGDNAGKEKITMTIEEASAPSEEEQPFATQDGTVQNVGNNAYYGDINGDGEADFADAVMLIRYDIGLLTLTDSQKKFGDVNGDGEVDFADAIRIMRFDAGFLTKLR